MRDQTGVFDRLRARGEEVFAQVSNELMSNPSFMRAMQAAVRGKEAMDETVGRVLKSMNVPTRTEFRRVLSRLDALESEVAALRARAAAPRPVARTASTPKASAARRKPARGRAGTRSKSSATSAPAAGTPSE